MTANTLQTFIAQPLHGYVPPLAMALWQLEEARGRTLRWLGGIDTALLDWSPPGERVNTIGTLLYHIALIEADWVFTDILRLPAYPDGVLPWFPVPARTADAWLSVVVSEPLAQHLERLSTVRRAVLDGLRDMTEADFSTPRTMPTYVVTPAWALHHLTQHEAEHRAEMSLLASRAGR